MMANNQNYKAGKILKILAIVIPVLALIWGIYIYCANLQKDIALLQAKNAKLETINKNLELEVGRLNNYYNLIVTLTSQNKIDFDQLNKHLSQAEIEKVNKSRSFTIKAIDKIMAKKCSANDGVQINISDVSHIDNGDWLEYQNIDFNNGGFKTFIVKLCKGNDSQGLIEIRLDSINGEIIGTLKPVQTGNDWDTWIEQSATVSNVKGIHDLYLTFDGEYGICNIDWFKFQ